MTVLRFDSVEKYVADKRLFSDITFEVAYGERVAVVGPNGIGKTTLLRIILGDEVDGGCISLSPDLNIGYLPQDFVMDPLSTPEKELQDAVSSNLDGPGRLELGLKLFGFSDNDMEQSIGTMSGGQKTKLALMKIWIGNPHLLLLDEPTNHLDTDGLDWLERFVSSFQGTVVMVSHDRYFLDKAATRIIELTPVEAVSYGGNYTYYRDVKEARRKAQEELFWEQERRARKLKTAVAQQMEWFRVSHRDAGKDSELRKGVKEFYRAKAAKIAKRAKCTLKRLDRLQEEKVEKPKDDPSIKMRFDDSALPGRHIVVAHGLSKAYGKRLFTDSSVYISRSDKVGLVGPNAAGKTTLLRLIMGVEAADAGDLRVSSSVRAGYLDQELKDLDTGSTVLDEAYSVVETEGSRGKVRARDLLGAFLFRGDDVFKDVGVLSMGERMRLGLVKLLLGTYNLLVLDEPTNHLDLPCRERLEEALEKYQGTLILVSHDRYLLNRVCSKIISIENQKIVTYLGGYGDYERSVKRKAMRETAGGSSNQQIRRLAKDEVLLLRNRQAVLSARLNRRDKASSEYLADEDEFLTIGRLLREYRLQ